MASSTEEIEDDERLTAMEENVEDELLTMKKDVNRQQEQGVEEQQNRDEDERNEKLRKEVAAGENNNHNNTKNENDMTRKNKNIIINNRKKVSMTFKLISLEEELSLETSILQGLLDRQSKIIQRLQTARGSRQKLLQQRQLLKERKQQLQWKRSKHVALYNQIQESIFKSKERLSRLTSLEQEEGQDDPEEEDEEDLGGEESEGQEFGKTPNTMEETVASGATNASRFSIQRVESSDSDSLTERDTVTYQRELTVSEDSDTCGGIGYMYEKMEDDFDGEEETTSSMPIVAETRVVETTYSAPLVSLDDLYHMPRLQQPALAKYDGGVDGNEDDKSNINRPYDNSKRKRGVPNTSIHNFLLGLDTTAMDLSSSSSSSSTSSETTTTTRTTWIEKIMLLSMRESNALRNNHRRNLLWNTCLDGTSTIMNINMKEVDQVEEDCHGPSCEMSKISYQDHSTTTMICHSRNNGSTFEHTGIRNTLDPNIALCPYELGGICADEFCPYQHLTPNRKTIPREQLLLPRLSLEMEHNDTEEKRKKGITKVSGVSSRRIVKKRSPTSLTMSGDDDDDDEHLRIIKRKRRTYERLQRRRRKRQNRRNYERSGRRDDENDRNNFVISDDMDDSDAAAAAAGMNVDTVDDIDVAADVDIDTNDDMNMIDTTISDENISEKNFTLRTRREETTIGQDFIALPSAGEYASDDDDSDDDDDDDENVDHDNDDDKTTCLVSEFIFQQQQQQQQRKVNTQEGDIGSCYLSCWWKNNDDDDDDGSSYCNIENITSLKEFLQQTAGLVLMGQNKTSDDENDDDIDNADDDDRKISIHITIQGGGGGNGGKSIWSAWLGRILDCYRLSIHAGRYDIASTLLSLYSKPFQTNDNNDINNNNSTFIGGTTTNNNKLLLCNKVSSKVEQYLSDILLRLSTSSRTFYDSYTSHLALTIISEFLQDVHDDDDNINDEDECWCTCFEYVMKSIDLLTEPVSSSSSSPSSPDVPTKKKNEHESNINLNETLDDLLSTFIFEEEEEEQQQQDGQGQEKFWKMLYSIIITCRKIFHPTSSSLLYSLHTLEHHVLKPCWNRIQKFLSLYQRNNIYDDIVDNEGNNNRNVDNISSVTPRRKRFENNSINYNKRIIIACTIMGHAIFGILQRCMVHYTSATSSATFYQPCNKNGNDDETRNYYYDVDNPEYSLIAILASLDAYIYKILSRLSKQVMTSMAMTKTTTTTTTTTKTTTTKTMSVMAISTIMMIDLILTPLYAANISTSCYLRMYSVAQGRLEILLRLQNKNHNQQQQQQQQQSSISSSGSSCNYSSYYFVTLFSDCLWSQLIQLRMTLPIENIVLPQEESKSQQQQEQNISSSSSSSKKMMTTTNTSSNTSRSTKMVIGKNNKNKLKLQNNDTNSNNIDGIDNHNKYEWEPTSSSIEVTKLLISKFLSRDGIRLTHIQVPGDWIISTILLMASSSSSSLPTVMNGQEKTDDEDNNVVLDENNKTNDDIETVKIWSKTMTDLCKMIIHKERQSFLFSSSSSSLPPSSTRSSSQQQKNKNLMNMNLKGSNLSPRMDFYGRFPGGYINKNIEEIKNEKEQQQQEQQQPKRTTTTTNMTTTTSTTTTTNMLKPTLLPTTIPKPTSSTSTLQFLPSTLPNSLLLIGMYIKELNLTQCHLHCLPISFGLYFPNLSKLLLSHNYLTYLPDSFIDMKQLEELYLDNNQLVTLNKRKWRYTTNNKNKHNDDQYADDTSTEKEKDGNDNNNNEGEDDDENENKNNNNKEDKGNNGTGNNIENNKGGSNHRHRYHDDDDDDDDTILVLVPKLRILNVSHNCLQKFSFVFLLSSSSSSPPPSFSSASSAITTTTTASSSSLWKKSPLLEEIDLSYNYLTIIDDDNANANVVDDDDHDDDGIDTNVVESIVIKTTKEEDERTTTTGTTTQPVLLSSSTSSSSATSTLTYHYRMAQWIYQLKHLRKIQLYPQKKLKNQNPK